MKKFLFAAAFIISLAVISPASAASWTNAVNAAINSGHFDQINVIAAQNPGAAGDIALYLFQQAANASNPGKATKLFNAATPLAGQISSSGIGDEIAGIQALLKLANDPGFQKSNPHGAGELFADALNLTSQPGVSGQDPHLHDLVLTQATDFLKNNPGLDDDKLKGDLLLAQGNDFLHNNPDQSVIRYTKPTAPSAE